MWLPPKIDWTLNDYYNAEDLNRVESNTQEVANLVRKVVGLTVSLNNPITNRDYKYLEFASDLNRIESNIQCLKVINIPWEPMKTNWRDGDSFDYRDANRLEINIYNLYKTLYGNSNNIRYCGQFKCGGGLI